MKIIKNYCLMQTKTLKNKKQKQNKTYEGKEGTILRGKLI